MARCGFGGAGEGRAPSTGSCVRRRARGQCRRDAMSFLGRTPIDRESCCGGGRGLHGCGDCLRQQIELPM
eukprot:1018511-Prorocentrum_lima.AAC.1